MSNTSWSADLSGGTMWIHQLQAEEEELISCPCGVTFPHGHKCAPSRPGGLCQACKDKGTEYLIERYSEGRKGDLILYVKKTGRFDVTFHENEPDDEGDNVHIFMLFLSPGGRRLRKVVKIFPAPIGEKTCVCVKQGSSNSCWWEVGQRLPKRVRGYSIWRVK